MVQPGVRVLSLLQQVSREFGRRNHGSSPCGHYWSRADTRCMMASLRAVMGRNSKSQARRLSATEPLLRGRDPEEVTTIVEATTGGGYTGIHRDPITNTNAAEFEVPKLGPQEKRTFTITLSGIGANSGIPRGTVKWERPRFGSGGTDLIAISTPLGK